MSTDAPERRHHGRRLAKNTAFFSFATGLSRLLGLAREVVAAAYFGVTGPMSAFTIAFQVPNLVRALFADAALQGAFVPVFTELLEKTSRYFFTGQGQLVLELELDSGSVIFR